MYWNISRSSFSDNYNIDTAIKLQLLFKQQQNRFYTDDIKESSLERKILFLVSLETEQNRYIQQVKTPLVNEYQRDLIIARLQTHLKQNDNVQVECQIDFKNPITGAHLFSAKGLADVVKNGVVYELKYVSELTHEHYLQCASYMVSMQLPIGILWNTRDNTLYEIEVPDREAFLDAVTQTITKGVIEKYH